MTKFKIFFLILFAITGYGQIKVACIGDSVTEGAGLNNPDTDAYPSQLQMLIGETYEVRNFGRSGATLLQKGHNPYLESEQFQKALDYRPDIAVIHLGLNDTDPRNWPDYGLEFQQDYATLINEIRRVNPEVKIYITLLTPIFSGHRRFLSGTRDWYQAIQRLIPVIAESNGVELIDINKDLKARIDLFDDFLHPNKQGAGIIARNVALAIAQTPQRLEIGQSIASHMVLQRDVHNSIYGKATPGEEIKLEFDGNMYYSKVKPDGSWSIELPAKTAGGPYNISISTNNEQIHLEDILFGDVYLAAGQSNMDFPLKSALNSQEITNRANQSKIRLFKGENIAKTHAVSWDSTILNKVNNLEFFEGTWELSTSENAADFSAIAYVMADELARETQIPIGIIDLSVGGSTTESWINRSDLENDNLTASYITNWRQSDFMMGFVKERSALNLKNSNTKHQRHPYDPAYNFEAGIQIFSNIPIKAALWYQGESNAHNIELHSHLFKMLVKSWRKHFKQDLPFYFIQLPGMNRASWGVFRNSQRILEKEIENTHMVVTLDLGEPDEVHPSNKIPIGKRLAMLIRMQEYQIPINAKHPELTMVEDIGEAYVLHFENASLLKTPGNLPVKGFQAMSQTGFLFPLEAEITENNQVKINKPSTKIQKILYSFEPFPEANLYNENDIPASTFEWTF